MNSSDLAHFIAQRQIPAELIELEGHTPTVEAAARVMGTRVERIAKSLLFLADGAPVLVIANGTARVDPRRVADHLGLARKRVRFADAETMERLTGYTAGSMPPFGHLAPLKTLVDRRALAEPELYAGGGSVRALLRVNPETICRVTGAEVVDVVNDG